ncbi:MAG: hypothetical protein A2992_06090 [Elusimicrobia bacterium RIFCSPLOWO2_01_FULL_59_12]|nr:MAG: hypothetical protein A2992_06090 [Elusimicrobia bacterium RIFCSPLOWO2_01_FULL_59_12]
MTDTLQKYAILGLASGCFLSYVPAWLLRRRRYTGAGLVGSLWGVALLSWLPLDPARAAAVWVGLLAIGVVAGDLAEEFLGKDDPRIVIDEWIGLWAALLFQPRTPAVIVSAFVLFRILDVYKPGWIRRAAGLPGGWGVVMDDVLAGVAANGLVYLGRVIISI